MRETEEPLIIFNSSHTGSCGTVRKAVLNICKLSVKSACIHGIRRTVIKAVISIKMFDARHCCKTVPLPLSCIPCLKIVIAYVL